MCMLYLTSTLYLKYMRINDIFISLNYLVIVAFSFLYFRFSQLFLASVILIVLYSGDDVAMYVNSKIG